VKRLVKKAPSGEGGNVQRSAANKVGGGKKKEISNAKCASPNLVAGNQTWKKAKSRKKNLSDNLSKERPRTGGKAPTT